MVTQTILENAHKFVYLASVYPEKNVTQVIDLFRLSPIDVNCAIWIALEKKWVEIEERQEVVPVGEADKPEDKPTKTVPVAYAKVLSLPEDWQFGNDVMELEEKLTYAFGKLNSEEKDLEENFLSNWITGYAPQDTLIAVKHLMDNDILHEYQIEDGDSAYIFYTLKKNAGENWGQKQFKTNPLTGEPNETEEAATQE